MKKKEFHKIVSIQQELEVSQGEEVGKINSKQEIQNKIF